MTSPAPSAPARQGGLAAQPGYPAFLLAATLVSDAHTTEDLSAWGAPPPDQVIAHTNLYWSNHKAPGRTAGTVETKDVDFG